ncbi:MAG: outer membrane lipoprotein [Enterobacterales bacterium]|jgi:outer membrane lipoprotein
MNSQDTKWINSSSRIMGLSLALLLSACSTMPESIQHQSPQQISVQAVHQGSTNISGQTVRWGGIITQVINNEKGTWVEVLALELNDIGRPSSNRLKNDGRFIAKVKQFLDPEVYQQGYSFTVVGTLAEKIDGKIGEFKYSYPTIDSQGHYLWPKYSRRTSHYVMPGYWYYGFHSNWHFGYNYYGYGIRYRRGFDYPYYPFYGHLTRRVNHVSNRVQNFASRKPYLANRMPIVSVAKNDKLWKLNTQRLTRQGREAKALTRRVDYNANNKRNQTANKTSTRKSSSLSNTSSRAVGRGSSRNVNRPVRTDNNQDN